MRWVRGLAALLALVALLVGIPAALVLLGGHPWPDHPSWARVGRVLLHRDDGTILFGVVTVIGWIAWLVFALSLVTEVVHLLSGFRIRLRMPGLAGPQRMVAGLLLAVVTMVAVPAEAGFAQPIASPVPVAAGFTASATAAGAAATAGHRELPLTEPGMVPTTSTHGGVRPVTHLVQRGDDLWSLAQHYYGQGRDWRKIAAANPHVLSGGPDRLQPGWRLTIPDLDLVRRPDRTNPTNPANTVTVRPGDTLRSIAERAYGRQDRYSDIFEANRSQLDDPDEIQVGIQLQLPPIASEHSSAAGGADHAARQSHGSTSSPIHSRPADPATPQAAPRTPVAPRDQESTTARRSAPPSTATPLPSATADPNAQPTDAPANPGQHPVSEESDALASQAALGVATVGGLLAAGVLGGLALRRRSQLQARPVGRRIPHPAARAQAVETALGHRQQSRTLLTLDLATRAVAAHCLQTDAPLPQLLWATVGTDAIELVLAEPSPTAPVGFQVSGRTWRLEQGDADYLAAVPGVEGAVHPFPTMVTVGSDDDGGQVMLDLEAVGLLSLQADQPQLAVAVLAAMAAELSFSPWADELVLTLVGSSRALPEALGKHNVAHTDDVDALLSRLEGRAELQRTQERHPVLGRHRIDPDLAEAWVPEIVLIERELTDEQGRRLGSVLTGEPRVTTAAVVAGGLCDAPWTLDLSGGVGEGSAASGLLGPIGLALHPQALTAPARRALVELVSTTGSGETTEAPWWQHEGGAPAGRPPDNVTRLGRRFDGWGQARAGDTEDSGTVAQRPVGSAGVPPHYPILRLLGPIELLGAQGAPPPRAAKQCLEYCGWLLENPGRTAQMMAAALIVAEGTRRSNMSRLRSWLGADGDGQPYLPDAYTGRILLHPSVSSDWQRLQILTAGGVNRTSSAGLQAALELVRGAPLADAAPGQWHWAEELRTDMISVVRDAGVELANRALGDQDLGLARWAAARALAAAPGDELLMTVRIRTEHRAGNLAETERLTLQLAAQARALGIDLESETVVLLQEVMEGQVRARMA